MYLVKKGLVGIGGAMLGTAQTKSSYYCICLLLTLQRNWNSVSAIYNANPHHLRLPSNFFFYLLLSL